jgi:hypothetical protein
MAVIHIPEEEAAKTLGSLVTRAAQRDEIVINGPSPSAKLVATSSGFPVSTLQSQSLQASRADSPTQM